MAVLCCLCITNISSCVRHSKRYASLRSSGLYSAMFCHVLVLFCMEAEAHMEEGQSHSAVTKAVKTATFYEWKYKHHFVVVVEGENNLRARCTLCPPSKKPLSSSLVPRPLFSVFICGGGKKGLVDLRRTFCSTDSQILRVVNRC